jgi:sulfite exporter TauE/SafE
VTGGILIWTAVTIAFLHTLIGVDHTLPFIVLGRARGWSFRRLWLITGVCGAGHVLSSVLLGFVGIGLGVALSRLEWIEGMRGGLAAWLLIGFGLAYAVWGLVRGMRGRRHTHTHTHADGTLHEHGHDHEGEHLHPHPAGRGAVTFWTLFIVFAFGPCEPLIPLLMVPALAHSWWLVAAVAGAFGAVTVGTMLTVVTVAYAGLRAPSFGALERYTHALAGIAIAGSGTAIRLFGI